MNRCDVCGKETNKIHVCSSAFGPVSFAYCDECLHNGREPYGAMVAYIACAGHFPRDINEAYQKLVRHNLKLADISEEQFIKDVDAVIKKWEEE